MCEDWRITLDEHHSSDFDGNVEITEGVCKSVSRMLTEVHQQQRVASSHKFLRCHADEKDN